MRTIAATLLMLALAGGCGRSAGPGTDALPEGRTFLSTSVRGHALVDDTRIRLSFTGNELRAYAGCNHLSGTVRADDGRLVVTAAISTDVGCDEDLSAQDQWLSEFLTGRPWWRLDGDELVLTKEDTELRLIDEKAAVPDRSLYDTRWVLDTITKHEVASSVPHGTTAWIRFRRDGLATGNAGCNDFGGSPTGNVEVSASSITFHEVVATEKSCGGAADDLEATVLGVLNGPVRYTVDGDVLTLVHPSDTALRYRAQ